ncbi:MAG: 1-deoxy-D-xylulose-5-phosphate synthase [Oscillospiraceae bacterium]
MGILDNINSPEDLKNLDENMLPELCQELRQFIIMNTAKGGGHLASNLGVVELTVAVHRVFDTSRDRLVFDVGHQSYVHKILTGRREKFPDIRTFGGISGFPKPEESIHDAFVAGHASSAISSAFGMARARTLLGEDYNVIALVGDGALTGGLSYEGLCDAGDSSEPFIVILNDNGMSITKNVGSIAHYLSHERMKRGYISFKNFYRRVTKRFPAGRRFYRFTHRIKQAIKEAIFHCSMFEDMGFTYLGPVDGHNIKLLISALKIARDNKGPVLVHVITKKGKGYKFAEENPGAYHGVSGFDPVSGEVNPNGESFSAVFGDELVKLAERDKRIMAITAAMSSGTGLADFEARFPERFFDVGIAEGHAVSMAGGAAHKGMVPVVAIYSTFLQRSYDMIMQDVAMGDEHVVLCVDRAGLVGEDGETHQGIFDVSYLSSIPGMTVFAPASFGELRDMLCCAVSSFNGPVAVRYPRGGEGEYKDGGCEASKLVREGRDFIIITYGITVNTAAAAADMLKKRGISVGILKLGIIKPIDFNAVLAAAGSAPGIMVLEECAAAGSVGERIAAYLSETGAAPKSLILKNLGDKFITHGTVAELRVLCGIDEDSVCEAISGAVESRNKAAD